MWLVEDIEDYRRMIFEVCRGVLPKLQVLLPDSAESVEGFSISILLGRGIARESRKKVSGLYILIPETL